MIVASVRHAGPTAQDFSGAFGPGADDRHIGSLDTGGIALAAIKALHARVKEKDTAIALLTARLDALERAMSQTTAEAKGNER